jgi:hypothetical protein
MEKRHRQNRGIQCIEKELDDKHCREDLLVVLRTLNIPKPFGTSKRSYSFLSHLDYIIMTNIEYSVTRHSRQAAIVRIVLVIGLCDGFIITPIIAKGNPN